MLPPEQTDSLSNMTEQHQPPATDMSIPPQPAALTATFESPPPATVATTSLPSQPAAIAMTSVPPQPATIAMLPQPLSSSIENQLQELQRRQQVQLHQLTSPSGDHPTGLGQGAAPPPQETRESSHEMLAPDANQALVDLQLLLQPPGEDMSKLVEPIQPEKLDLQDSQLGSAHQPHPPQRPAKPVHLQSEAVAPPTLVAPPGNEGGDVISIEGEGQREDLPTDSSELPVAHGELLTPVVPADGGGRMPSGGEQLLPVGGQPQVEGGMQLFQGGLIEGEHPIEGEQRPIEGAPQLQPDILQPLDQSQLFVPPGGEMATPQTGSTLTTNSISRPIPAPVQSPPPPTSPDHTPPPAATLSVSPPPLEVSPSSSIPPSVADMSTPGSAADPSVHQPPPIPTSLAYSLTASEESTRTSLYPLDSITQHDPLPSVSTHLYESSTAVPGHPGSPPHDQSMTHSLQSSEFNLSHGIDTNLSSLPQPSMMSQLPSLASVPPSLTVPFSTSHTFGHDTQLAKMELLVEQQKEIVEKKTREVEEGRAQIADQKRQLDTYKQQVALLQQQLSQVSAQQQKQEQEKVTVSGQQAVLMQLLQQQQGMFSQQQAQLEVLSKASEDHHKQLQESEMKYRQALAVEQEQKSSLQNQVLQLNQEVQRLSHQLQGQSQQHQTAQMQVYQYHTQIQERDKQLVAFRDQHKDIVQKLEQKHQEKVVQLVQQIQELQLSLKKSREQQRTLQGGMPQPIRVVGPPVQFQQPPQTPRQPQPSPQLPQQQQSLPQQPPMPQQQQPLPQQQQPLPQQQSLPQQPPMSQGMSVAGTPTSVQAMGLPHSAHQPPTSTSWPPGSQGLPRQTGQTYTGPIPGQSHTHQPQHMQSPQSITQSPGMVAPGNRPVSTPSHPIAQAPGEHYQELCWYCTQY